MERSHSGRGISYLKMIDEEGNITLKLPATDSQGELVFTKSYSASTIAERQVLAAEQTASALTVIAQFLQEGGIEKAINTLVKGNGIAGMLSGLAHHDGRKALDARLLKQNALEIVEQLELVYKKYNERLSSQNARNPDILNAEESQGLSPNDS